MKYSKFSNRDVIVRAGKLLSQIVGEDKVVNKKDEKVVEKAGETQGSGRVVAEVVFDSFFGSEVKELFKVAMGYSVEKVAACLLGPKIPIYGFEQVINSIGMRLVRSDQWEENSKTGSFTRKFIYSLKHMENVFQNTEIIEQTQTFNLKKYN